MRELFGNDYFGKSDKSGMNKYLIDAIDRVFVSKDNPLLDELPSSRSTDGGTIGSPNIETEWYSPKLSQSQLIINLDFDDIASATDIATASTVEYLSKIDITASLNQMAQSMEGATLAAVKWVGSLDELNKLTCTIFNKLTTAFDCMTFSPLFCSNTHCPNFIKRPLSGRRWANKARRDGWIRDGADWYCPSCGGVKK